MRHFSMKIIGYCCLGAVVLSAAAGCSPRRIPPKTVEDLMEDRVTLDGIMMKCNQDPAKWSGTEDCEKARIAINRLSSQEVDPTVDKKHQEQFEHAREQLRLAQDKQRQDQESKTKVDAYSLPVVPVNPPAPVADPNGAAPQSGASPQSGANSPRAGNSPGPAAPTLAGTTP